MSHHYSGPDFTVPHGDARVDLCDLFAFPKPGDPDKSILIMDVHPSVSVNPPGPTRTDPFATDAIYELKVDTDGDAIANIAYRIRFAPSANGGQTATVFGSRARSLLAPAMAGKSSLRVRQCRRVGRRG